ncbi:MAG: hypothetical protein EKK48_17895 [Candidatus Melainabacteria bacterium]|nr:MAG: hypothetical protein EKK48_17895 [Candidatus Melainabacteria bacterium]
MRENQLPVHHTAAEETGRVRPAVDSGDGGVHILSEQVADLAVRPVGNYLADDLTNSVQITMAHCSAAGSASKAPAVVVAPRALPGDWNQYVADDPERQSRLEDRDSKSEKWLLAAAVISVTTLFTTLSTLSNPERVPSFVAQTVKISKQLSSESKRRFRTTFGGTAVAATATARVGTADDAAKAGVGTVAGAAKAEVGAAAASGHGATPGSNSALVAQPKDETAISGVNSNSVVPGVVIADTPDSREVGRPAAHHDGSTRGERGIIASGTEETGTHENSRAIEMPKVAETRTSKLKTGFLVPPPPPTPCILPSALGLFPMQSDQQYLAAQQQLQQAQAQASLNTHKHAGNMTQQPTAASGRTEGTQSDALVDADQKLQSALNSSLHTVGEWTR